MLYTCISKIQKRNYGIVAGLIACILAIGGMMFLSLLLIPLAILAVIGGTVLSLVTRNSLGIKINAVAWILIIVGIFSSRMLLMTLIYLL